MCPRKSLQDRRRPLWNGCFAGSKRHSDFGNGKNPFQLGTLGPKGDQCVCTNTARTERKNTHFREGGTESSMISWRRFWTWEIAFIFLWQLDKPGHVCFHHGSNSLEWKKKCSDHLLKQKFLSVLVCGRAWCWERAGLLGVCGAPYKSLPCTMQHSVPTGDPQQGSSQGPTVPTGFKVSAKTTKWKPESSCISLEWHQEKIRCT